MRRAVITGIGVVSSIGNNKEEVLESLRAGKSGIAFNQEFADWFNAIVNTDVPADTVFAGVDTDTQDFLNNRAAQLAA